MFVEWKLLLIIEGKGIEVRVKATSVRKILYMSLHRNHTWLAHSNRVLYHIQHLIISNHMTSCHIISYLIVSYHILSKCVMLYFIVLYCIVLYCIVLYCIVLYCIVLYCIVLHCIVLHCTALYCIVLYCIVLYCIVLYCIVFFGTLLLLSIFPHYFNFLTFPLYVLLFFIQFWRMSFCSNFS